jgi:diguanylate cyclase (GGDEF)-like protein
MAFTDRRRKRFGNALLVAVLAVNFLCGAVLLGRLRAAMTRELITAERAHVSARINAYLSGRILLFSSVVREMGTPDGEARSRAELARIATVRVLPVEWDFRRVRMGTDGPLPLYVGRPLNVKGQGLVLPVAYLAAERGSDRFVVGTVSLGDLSGYLADLEQRGILCRIVDREGNTLLGAVKGFVDQDAGANPWLEPAGLGRFAPEWRVRVSIPAAGSRLPLLPQALLAALVLLNTVFILYLRQQFLRPQQAALCQILRSLSSRGEISRAEKADPADVADAVEELLARKATDSSEEVRQREEDRDRRFREMAQSRKHLMAHHKLTKKMLQARETDEVYETLLNGIVEGYGFQAALLGRVNRDGYLTFPGEPDPSTGNPVRIPLWNPGSLFARAFWGGKSMLLPLHRDLARLPEEAGLLSEGIEDAPIFLAPLMRTLKVRCAEMRNCGDRLCPYFFSEDRKCWLRNAPPGEFSPGANPELFREPLLQCLACETFPASAFLLLRTTPAGTPITRQSVAPVVSLASEAMLALEVVSLYNNMKLMAITDGLTGLFNHREFYNALRRELERARRYRHPLSLLIIDVDDFKAFNDRFGHLAGDHALRKIADVIRRSARSTDIIARYGGEEFALILPESVPKGALMVAERIKIEMAETNFIRNSSIFVNLTVSIGLYTSEHGDISEDQMVSLADEAAYRAKLEGKNRVVVRAPR